MASTPRCFFALMPDAAQLEVLSARVADAGVLKALGSHLFAPTNWHQTLSDRYWNPDPATVDRLLHAGSLIRAEVFTLTLRGIDWSLDERDPARPRRMCTLRTDGGKRALDRCLAAVAVALDKTGFPPQQDGHTPHITLSYNAPDLRARTGIVPFDWTIGEILLVEGDGEPYRYRVLGRWPLQPTTAPQGQVDLFA